MRDLLDAMAVVRDQSIRTPMVHIVSGEALVGKTAFCASLISRLKLQQQDYWIFPIDQVPGTGSLPTAFLRMTRESVRCRDRSESSWSRFVLSLNPQASVTAALKNLDKLHAAHWIESMAKTLFTSPLSLRLLFVVEDFDRWEPEVRRDWLMHFWKAIIGSDCGPRVDLVMTVSDEEMSETLGRELGVKSVGSEIHYLSPLSEEDSKKVARRWVPDSVDIHQLIKDARGLPGKIEKLSKSYSNTRSGNSSTSIPENLLKGLNSRQLTLVACAAYLRQVCEDGIELLMGKVSAGDLRWLKRHILPFQQADGSLPLDLRESISAWAQRHLADLLPLRRDLIERINVVIERIPDESHRKSLVHFALFTRFDEDLLKLIFKDEASRLLDFMNSNRGYFDIGDSILRLNPYFISPAKAYADLIGFDRDGRISDKLSQVWSRERKELEKELHSCHEKMRKDEQARSEIVEELAKVSSSLNKIRPKEVKKKPQKVKLKKSNHEHDFLSRMIGSVMVVGGIFMLYLSILFSGKFNLTYGLFGVGLVFWGFVIALKRKHVAVPIESLPVREAAPSIPNEVRKQIRYLELKQLSLENKKTTLGMGLSEARHRAAYIESCLKQPLI